MKTIRTVEGGRIGDESLTKGLESTSTSQNTLVSCRIVVKTEAIELTHVDLERELWFGTDLHASRVRLAFTMFILCCRTLVSYIITCDWRRCFVTTDTQTRLEGRFGTAIDEWPLLRLPNQSIQNATSLDHQPLAKRPQHQQNQNTIVQATNLLKATWPHLSNL